MAPFRNENTKVQNTRRHLMCMYMYGSRYVYSQGCSIVYIAVAMSKMADLVCKINEKTCKLKEMVLEKCVT